MPMVPVYLDSFAYGLADLILPGRNWVKTETGGGNAITISGGEVFFNQPAGTTTKSIRRPLGANYASLSVHWKLRYTRSLANGENIITLEDGTTDQLVVETTDTSGTISVLVGSTAQITATNIIPDDNLHDYELIFKIHSSTGFIELFIDGVSAGSFTGDTQNSANAYATHIVMNPDNNSVCENRFSHFSIWELDGGGDAEQVGPHFVGRLNPTSDGNYTAWQFSTGSVGWSLIDETTSTGDSDYIHETAAGDRASFGITDPDATASVLLGYQVCVLARKTDATTREIGQFLRLSSTDLDGPTHVMTTAYQMFFFVGIDSPAGGDLGISDLISTEIGVRVVT